MMIGAYVFLIILLMIITIGLTRDFANPLVCSGMVWLVVYYILSIVISNRSISGQYSYVFAIAYLFYFLGFYLINRKINLGSITQNEKNNITIGWNEQYVKLIFFIEYLMGLYWIYECWGVLRSRAGSIWQAFRLSMEDIPALSSGLAGVVRNIIPIIFIVSFAYYLYYPSFRNKKNLIISIPPMLLTMLFNARSGWFFVMITCAFVYIYIRRPKNRKIAIVGLALVAIILVVFFVSSFDKFSNAYTSESNGVKLQRFISGYFLSPPAALLQWLNHGFECGYGIYTFRFICALLNPIFPSIEVVETVQPFVNVVGYRSNVYTALQWYINDFGIWWCCLVEFFLGLLYGGLYKIVRMSNYASAFDVIILSMLLYPIFNQFFDEKLFSVASIWIQRIIALWVFTKTPLTSGDIVNYWSIGRIRFSLGKNNR